MENKQKGDSWLIVVLVVAIVAYGLWLLYQNTTPSSTTTTTNNTQQVVPTEDISAGSIDVGAPAATISYTDALVKYANARLQLDDNCQANSQSQKMTFKNNAYLMIDNRAPVARTVHIGSVFTVKAYSFKIVQLSSSTLPVTWLVDCDTSQNVATITIQK